ncbi:MAG: glycerol-3-phosphate dehydrogenase [Rhodothalassiaceae bacterium]
MTDSPTYDLLVVGGGVNGAGIAADATARGLKVLLAEKDDLASATSSASSKLIHGGIRYLEHYEFRLVRKALAEREILLHAAPHIVWPLRFRLPHLPSLRPAWMIRIGLFLYDHLARRGTLPGSRSLIFGPDSPLRPEIRRGFEYSDCWVDDARLVVLNAMAARRQGGDIRTRTLCRAARREGGLWHARLENRRTGEEQEVRARALVNAAGPWVQSFIEGALGSRSPRHVRLVKGSHIVVPRLYEGEQCYILQNDDKRIVFALPYEERFTLIGTTDRDFSGDPAGVAIDEEERDYLIAVIARYFRHPVTAGDVVWSYSGVRPLLDDDSGDPSAVTRDYRLIRETDDRGRAPLLSVFGGKITTYRRLAEEAIDLLAEDFPGLAPSPTAHLVLPGGDFAGHEALFAEWHDRWPWMPADILARYVRSYGRLAEKLIGTAKSLADLGANFGAGLLESEIRYLMAEEWAETADDILWRRTKRGLFLDAAERDRLEGWLAREAVTTP